MLVLIKNVFYIVYLKYYENDKLFSVAFENKLHKSGVGLIKIKKQIIQYPTIKQVRELKNTKYVWRGSDIVLHDNLIKIL